MKAEARRRLIDYDTTLYGRHGDDVRSLGWSRTSQQVRFARATAEVPANARTLLDVGCGFGQLADYLGEHRPDLAYIGFEINPDFLAICRRRSAGAFAERDIFDDPPPARSLDATVAIGIFNTETGDNEALIRALIGRLYDAAVMVAILSATSSYVDVAHRHDSTGMHYYAPAELFSFAKTIARDVDLRHSYLPHDFMLVLHR